MFCHWMPLQESVVEGHRVAEGPSLQHLLGPIQLRNQHSHLLLQRSHFHNPHHHHKAASGEVVVMGGMMGGILGGMLFSKPGIRR